MENVKNIIKILVDLRLYVILFLLRKGIEYSESEIYKKIKFKKETFDDTIDFLIKQKYINSRVENKIINFPYKAKLIWYFKITIQGKRLLYYAFFELIFCLFLLYKFLN